MDLRIQRRDVSAADVTLVLAGWVAGDCTAILRAECEGLLAAGRRVTLEMAGVRFADPGGVHLLRDLRERGVRCDGLHGFIDELLGGAPVA